MAAVQVLFPSFRTTLLFCLSLLLPGCSTVRYYSQAVHGHFQIQSSRVPIQKLLSNPNTPDALKNQLRQVLALRDFATTELQLPAGRNYLRYADLKRPHVVWTVHATPQFSLQSKRWWYPLVGRLKYRGFFDASRAEQLAGQLRSEGNDVFLGGVDAYSTLGWFSDPVLNTFIDREPTYLAELIFHELAHRRYFRRGDTDFNEAFATFVSEIGVRKWIQSQPASEQPKLIARFEQSLERDRILVEAVQETRSRLAGLYLHVPANGPTNPEEHQAILMQKHQILQDLESGLNARLKDPKSGQSLIRGPWNNARLNTVSTYHDLVPQFRKRYQECNEDLAVFLKSIRQFHPQRDSNANTAKELRRSEMQSADSLMKQTVCGMNGDSGPEASGSFAPIPPFSTALTHFQH